IRILQIVGLDRRGDRGIGERAAGIARARLVGGRGGPVLGVGGGVLHFGRGLARGVGDLLAGALERVVDLVAGVGGFALGLLGGLPVAGGERERCARGDEGRAQGCVGFHGVLVWKEMGSV